MFGLIYFLVFIDKVLEDDDLYNLLQLECLLFMVFDVCHPLEVMLV